jgi:hypothetical protein
MSAVGQSSCGASTRVWATTVISGSSKERLCVEGSTGGPAAGALRTTPPLCDEQLNRAGDN